MAEILGSSREKYLPNGQCKLMISGRLSNLRYSKLLVLLMKSSRNKTCVSHSLEHLMPIISISDNGCLILRLPGFLQSEQKELEQMLHRVFANRLDTPDNLALAQQLSLNWCASKVKKTDSVIQ